MRAARLPAFAALLGLHILGVQGETTCYTDDLLTNWSVDDLSRLQGALVGPVFDLCNKGFTPGEDEVLTQQVGDVSFAIVREATAQDGADCKSAFSTIIKQCVIGQKVGGGVIESLSGNGVLYEVSHANAVHEKLEGSHVDVRDEDKFDVEEGHLDDFMDLVGHDSSLETRAPKGGRVKTPKAKPKTPKAKPKPKTPTAKPKPKVSKAPKSKPAKASKTTSSAKPLATKSCDQLYAMALASRITEKPLARRAGFVGSMAHIEKRNQKDGTACGIELNALDYPEDLPANAKYYGYSKPKQCSNIVFGQGTTSRAPGTVRADYQIEHVLEWQLVTKFFDWVEKNKVTGKPFDHPDPTSKTKKVGFCMYWKETWSNSWVPTFKMGTSDEERTPFNHLKHAYPGKKNFEDEFIWLQKPVNTPAKRDMWSAKTGTGIYGKTKIVGKIQGVMTGKGKKKTHNAAEIDQAKLALMDLKYLMGARKYMRSAHIQKIFKKQVDRIGDMLDKLDNEMPKHPKKNTKTNKVYGAWKPQGLKVFWFEYMAARFEMAKKRTNNDMDDYLALLKKEWAGTSVPTDKALKTFRDDITAIDRVWTKEKATKWVKPW